MPTKITNPELLKYIKKMEKTTSKLMLQIKGRERMNDGFRVMMDNIYGEYNWGDTDLKECTVTLQDEVDKHAFTITNPKFCKDVRREDVTDVEVVTVDKTNEVTEH